MKWNKDTHYTQIKLLPAKTLILLFATTNLHTKIAYFTMGHRASGTKQTAHKVCLSGRCRSILFPKENKTGFPSKLESILCVPSLIRTVVTNV